MARTNKLIEPMLSSSITGSMSSGYVTREYALTFPVVARALDIVTGMASAARFSDTSKITADPRCGESSFMADCVADLMFDGYSVLSWDDSNRIVYSEPQETVELMGYTPTSPWRALEDIPGIFIVRSISAGILSRGYRTLARLEDAYRVLKGRSNNPIPLIELHQNDDRQSLGKEQVRALVDSWSQARQSTDTGAVAYTPASVKLVVHGEQQLQESRANVTSINSEMAVLLGVPASYLGLPVESTGLTYSNPESRVRELLGATLAPLLRYIEDGVSLATGGNVSIDTTAIGLGDLESRSRAYKAAIEVGVLTPQKALTIESQSAL